MRCCVCYSDETELGDCEVIECASGHVTCAECFNEHVKVETAKGAGYVRFVFLWFIMCGKRLGERERERKLSLFSSIINGCLLFPFFVRLLRCSTVVKKDLFRVLTFAAFFFFFFALCANFCIVAHKLTSLKLCFSFTHSLPLGNDKSGSEKNETGTSCVRCSPRRCRRSNGARRKRLTIATLLGSAWQKHLTNTIGKN